MRLPGRGRGCRLLSGICSERRSRQARRRVRCDHDGRTGDRIVGRSIHRRGGAILAAKDSGDPRVVEAVTPGGSSVPVRPALCVRELLSRSALDRATIPSGVVDCFRVVERVGQQLVRTAVSWSSSGQHAFG